MSSLAERVKIQQGDLTEMDTDAIVNAANNDLIWARASRARFAAKAEKKFSANAMRLEASLSGTQLSPQAEKLKGAIRDSCGEHATWRQDECGVAAAFGGTFFENRQ